MDDGWHKRMVVGGVLGACMMVESAVICHVLGPGRMGQIPLLAVLQILIGQGSWTKADPRLNVQGVIYSDDCTNYQVL